MSDPMQNVRVVLIAPLYGGNVGAVCRAMMNCGMTDLSIAEPRDNLDMTEARIRAYHAEGVLDDRHEFPTLNEAVADCGLIAGTTARMGLYRCHAKSPREWAPALLEAAAGGTKVALVFGPEDKGMSNEHLALCTHILQIPSSDMYVSLNLSHAVMICCHELFVASGAFENAAYEWTPDAPSDVRERMFAMWRQTMLDTGFMKEDKSEHMMLGLRRILSRGKLTIADVKILMGIARQTQWFVNHARQQQDPHLRPLDTPPEPDMESLPEIPTPGTPDKD